VSAFSNRCTSSSVCALAMAALMAVICSGEGPFLTTGSAACTQETDKGAVKILYTSVVDRNTNKGAIKILYKSGAHRKPTKVQLRYCVDVLHTEKRQRCNQDTV